MYSSWQHLIIKNETQLQDIKRIRKLIWSSGTVGWLGVIGFALAGIASLLFAGSFIYIGMSTETYNLTMFAVAVLMTALAALFFVGTNYFTQEIKINLIRNFVKNPQAFDFIEGTLVSAGYVSNGSKRQNHYVVVGKAISKEGVELLAQEQFASRIWHFTTREDDEQLKEGDDWFDLKGKRPYLPIPAYFICLKKDPKFAALVAVDEKYLLAK